MTRDFLDELNNEQKLAVTTTQGPVMIVAGAGSGKTRVLTYRIAYLLNSHVEPFRVLALTFTNKASREMRQRVEKLVGPEARNIWMGTFHSVFAKILRIEAHRLGYPSNFTIYDTDDAKSVIKSILKEEQLDPQVYKPNQVLARISLAKNNFISPMAYLQDHNLTSEDAMGGKPKLGQIYLRYCERCQQAGAMDFDDILLKTYELFQKSAEALNKYQQKFKYVLVDEYQDTNHIQYLIIRKLAAVHQNICVVGDDAQSIYAFRGANIRNILDFEKDYPDLKVFKLEQNYRSTRTIVNAAGCVISKNKYQLQKVLWTGNPAGNKIRVFKSLSEGEEGRQVAQNIFEEKMEHQRQNADFAILYRTNAQSRAFEEWLRKLNLNYRIIGGLSFYQRKEIKDLLGYFRLALNPKDEEAIKRVINFPKRGIGNTSLEKLIIASREYNIPLWEVMERIGEFGVDGRLRKQVQDFVVMIKSFTLRIPGTPAYEMAMAIANESGLLKLFNEDKSVEGMSRHENLQQLLAAIQEFSERNDLEEKHLGVFMQEVALLTDADTKDDSEDKVTLMTIHGAKGLEFPVVYVVGLEENLFPSQLSMQSREDLEEERRLFYVAITRAREKLYLSYAGSRFIWGSWNPSDPSRFLDEIDSQYLEYDVRGAERNAREEGLMTNSFLKKLGTHPRGAEHPKPALTSTADFEAEELSGLQVGMEVEHNRFGQGKVIQLEGAGDTKKATIFFPNLGNKQILLKFARMKVVR